MQRAPPSAIGIPLSISDTSRTLKCQHPLISPNKPNFSLMKAVQGYQLDVEQSNKLLQSCQHHNVKNQSPYCTLGAWATVIVLTDLQTHQLGSAP